MTENLKGLIERPSIHARLSASDRTPIHQVRDVHSMVWRDVSEETFELLRSKPGYSVRVVFAKDDQAA